MAMTDSDASPAGRSRPSRLVSAPVAAALRGRDARAPRRDAGVVAPGGRPRGRRRAGVVLTTRARLAGTFGGRPRAGRARTQVHRGRCRIRGGRALTLTPTSQSAQALSWLDTAAITSGAQRRADDRRLPGVVGKAALGRPARLVRAPRHHWNSCSGSPRCCATSHGATPNPSRLYVREPGFHVFMSHLQPLVWLQAPLQLLGTLEAPAARRVFAPEAAGAVRWRAASSGPTRVAWSRPSYPVVRCP